MSRFTKRLPEWNKPGIEPPNSKKTVGWQPDERPPAEYLNWLANQTFESLKELQDNAAHKEETEQLAAQLADIAVNVKIFGAKGDGITNDTQAFIDALAVSGSIFIPSGTYLIDEVILPAKDVYIYSNSATLKGTNGTFIFKQRKRGYLTKLQGILFVGNSTAFHYDSEDSSLPSHGQNYEYVITNCRFLQSSLVTAINLYGVREGVIQDCYFDGNNGILTEFSINTIISDCQFKNCKYIVRSKLGSEGLIISNAVALGCEYGVLAERTTGVQLINSMIDYCDIPVFLKGATDVLINNNYISSRTSQAAITSVKYDDGFNGFKYIISNNNLRTNSNLGERVVSLEDIYDGIFTNNILSNYKINGLEYGNVLNFRFLNNVIRHAGGSGINSIYNLRDDSSTVVFESNNVTKPIATTSAIFFRNAGFKTENSGEAVLTNGQTNVVVNHGLAVKPSKLDIMLTPTTPNTRDINYYISEVTDTTFTISVVPAVSAGTTAFAWKKI